MPETAPDGAEYPRTRAGLPKHWSTGDGVLTFFNVLFQAAARGGHSRTVEALLDVGADSSAELLAAAEAGLQWPSRPVSAEPRLWSGC